MAPRFFSRTVIAVLVLVFSFAGTGLADSIIAVPADAQALITTTLPPANYVVTPPSGFDSVARLIIQMPGGTFGCSGSLIAGTTSILTAGHCISDGAGNVAVNSLTATFNTPGGPVVRNGVAYYLPPGWNGDFGNGSDLAVVTLDAPVGLPGYTLWTGADPFFSTVDVAGYGLTGTGLTGYGGAFGTLRAGQNFLDPVYWGIPGKPYAWDFDDGTAAHDALCILTGGFACQTGVGDGEVLIAPGDSGGPMFFGGRLLGVHSFGATFGPPIDIDGVLNSTFGELGGDTRVNAYSGWIMSVAVPEPGAIVLLFSGLAALIAWRRRRQ